MKKIIGLVLIAASMSAFAYNCTTQIIVVGSEIKRCQTCCNNIGCTTYCY